MGKSLSHSTDSIYVVQFLHPGSEHRPDKDGFVAWNRGLHKRKFVECRGAFVKSPRQKKPKRAPIHFWTEWEAESQLICELSVSGTDDPRYLFKPILRPQQRYAELCNTDPCVFGGFYYCICQQRGIMRKLGRGSLILFGSRRHNRFVLDTVFVVDRWEPHSAGNYKSLDLTLEYRAVGLAPMYDGLSRTDCHDGPGADDWDRLYYGATFQKPVGGMFSFFPCLPAAHSTGFPRPTIRLKSVITDNLSQGFRRGEVSDLKTASVIWTVW